MILVILGIIIAVAIPKYQDIQDNARLKVALGGISEYQGRLSASYARLLLERTGSQPTVASIISGANTDIGPDFLISSTPAGTIGVNISVSQIEGVTLSTAATGIWVLPTS